jgi:hypothetical protein
MERRAVIVGSTVKSSTGKKFKIRKRCKLRSLIISALQPTGTRSRPTTSTRLAPLPQNYMKAPIQSTWEDKCNRHPIRYKFAARINTMDHQQPILKQMMDLRSQCDIPGSSRCRYQGKCSHGIQSLYRLLRIPLHSSYYFGPEILYGGFQNNYRMSGLYSDRYPEAISDLSGSGWINVYHCARIGRKCDQPQRGWVARCTVPRGG